MVKNCSNIAYPPGGDITYKEHFESFGFPLSDFQKYAIEAIVEGQHVLVCAPTGSGKTLPAEFAIDHLVQKGKRLIYCSPIKALSNQKYYDFSNKFPHISFGLFTGDVKVNPDSQVLIMTTEILMNFLFSPSAPETPNPKLQFQMDIQTELGCVIFDEVHYILDEHRGNVWENSILMMPKHVQMVMLSATIDNPERFANWCERGDSEKQVYLIYTNYRIVPLTHYSYLTTSESIFKKTKDKALHTQIRDTTNRLIKIQTEKGIFQEKAYHDVKHILDVFDKNQHYMKRKHVINNLATHLREHDMLPAVIFVFSRKQVEICAHEITTNLLEDDSKIPYIVRRECEQIIRKFSNYHEYLELPEYNDLVSLLEKGIGIHHSGMIPVLREIVELLITKKYIKVLVATDSVGIGLNLPIRTSVFVGLTKFDGVQQRFLLSHEYTQAAGRSGRRGLDTVGHVIHCNNLFELPSMTEYKGILCGKPQSLSSKFHISYSVVLHLLQLSSSRDNMIAYLEKSMLYEEIISEIDIQQKNIDDINAMLIKKEEYLQMMRTPIGVCQQYLDMIDSLSMASAKKKKQIQKESEQLLAQYKYGSSDIKSYEDYKSIQTKLAHETNILLNLKHFIPTQLDKILEILTSNTFITFNVEYGYGFTDMGIIASNVAEIHPLVIAKCVSSLWNFFESFSAIQMVGLFSCFTDIKLPEKMQLNTDDSFLKDKIQEVTLLYSDYERLEATYGVNTGIQYADALMFDMVDDMMKWCDCFDETECKYFIQTVLHEKNISIGDFVKAVMKISAIAKELANVGERLGKVDMIHKLNQIDTLILKYVTMNQSLYI